MKKGLSLVLVLVLALSVRGFAFQNEPDGFRGLLWGDPPEEDMINKSKDTDNPDWFWYNRADESLQIGRRKMHSISYGFYQGRFFYVSLRTDYQGGTKDPVGYLYLKDVLIVKFGRGQNIDRVRGYIDRWNGSKSTIVLQALREGTYLTIYSTTIFGQMEQDKERKRVEKERQWQEKHWEIRNLEAAQEGLGDF